MVPKRFFTDCQYEDIEVLYHIRTVQDGNDTYKVGYAAAISTGDRMEYEMEAAMMQLPIQYGLVPIAVTRPERGAVCVCDSEVFAKGFDSLVDHTPVTLDEVIDGSADFTDLPHFHDTTETGWT